MVPRFLWVRRTCGYWAGHLASVSSYASCARAPCALGALAVRLPAVLVRSRVPIRISWKSHIISWKSNGISWKSGSVRWCARMHQSGFPGNAMRFPGNYVKTQKPCGPPSSHMSC